MSAFARHVGSDGILFLMSEEMESLGVKFEAASCESKHLLFMYILLVEYLYAYRLSVMESLGVKFEATSLKSQFCVCMFFVCALIYCLYLWNIYACACM